MTDLLNMVLDKAQCGMEYLKNIEQVKKLYEFLNSDPNLKEYKNLLDQNEVTKPISNFINDSNNKNVVKFEWGGQVREFDYFKRRRIVLYTMGVFIARDLWKKRLFLKYFIFYGIISMFLCRENFDMRNYKIEDTKKP
jgi:hypothetical protein